MPAYIPARDVIERARITQVVMALGGKVRRDRCQAFWRNGDGWNVSLNDEKAAWFDHARGEGGGILNLVQLVRDCSRGEALKWLADFVGISLYATPLTRAEKTALARRRVAAELEAQTLIDWRNTLIGSLRSRRMSYFHLYHELKTWLISNSLHSPLSAVIADLCDIHENAYQELDDDIDRLWTAPFPALLPIFREYERRG